MTDRISNLALQQTTVKQMLNLQSGLAKIQGQISSGQNASTFTDLATAGDLQQVTSLETQLQQVNNYVTNNGIVTNQVNAATTAVGNLISVATNVRNLITTRLSPAGTVTPVDSEAQSFLSTIQDALNTNYAGTYIFAGGQTNTPPVGDINSISNIVNGVATSNYYKGDDTQLKVNNSDNTALTYNVTADSPGFQQLIGAINLAVTAQANNDNSGFTNALNMVNNAITNITAVQTTLSDTGSALSQISSSQQNVQEYLNQYISADVATDIPSATVQATLDETSLEATYQVFAKISQLSLTQYLPNA